MGYLAGWVGICRARSVLITVVYGPLDKNSVVMGSHPDFWKLHMLDFWIIHWSCLGILRVLEVFGCRYAKNALLFIQFSGKKPTWGLPSSGQVSVLLAAGGSDVGLVEVRPAGREQLTQAGF